MKFFNGLIVGIILGAAGYWFLQKQAREHPEAEKRYEDSASRAGATASETAHNLSDAVKAKLETLDLRGDQVKDEMARTGKVVRRNTQDLAGKVADAASDVRAVTEIKAKYAADPDLSVWSISVSCHDGHVALSGTVPTPEGVGRAVALALQADGVSDVTSTLEIKPKS
jgi:osmotically-inducible protein OsmY